MTHEQKPESAEFRTLETQVNECARDLHASLIALEEKLYVEFAESEARGAAERETQDIEEAKDEGANYVLTSLALLFGRDGFEIWDGSETWEGDVNATLEGILKAGGLVDDEGDLLDLATLKDRLAEQRRKDAEGAEPVAWQYEVNGLGEWQNGEVGYGPDVWRLKCGYIKPDRDDPDYRSLSPLYDHPANVAALEARVKELEGELTQSAKRAFNHGYLIACCNISHLHDEPSIARDVLAECGLSAVDISAIELSDYDAKALAEIRISRGDQDPIRSGEQL